MKIPRLVLCYIDYLGALYCGYDGRKRNGRKVISTPQKARTYISDILGEVYPLYRDYGDLLYEMYRHGTVHLYQPKVLFNKKTNYRLSWVLYKAPRTAPIGYYGVLTHMLPKRMGTSNEWVLPISISYLYTHLNKSINQYIQLLKKNEEFIQKWNSTAEALLEPDFTKLTWGI